MMNGLVVLLTGSDVAFNVADLLSAGAEAIKADIFAALFVIVPVAVAVVGAVVSVKFGLKWLRSLGK